MLFSRLLAYHALSALCKQATAAPLYRLPGGVLATLDTVSAIDTDADPHTPAQGLPAATVLDRRQAPNATATATEPSTTVDGCRAHNDSPCPFIPPVPASLRGNGNGNGNGTDSDSQADEAHAKPWDRHPSPGHPLKGGLIPLHGDDIPNDELASLTPTLQLLDEGAAAAAAAPAPIVAAEAMTIEHAITMAKAMKATTDAKADAPVDHGESSGAHAHGKEIAIAADDPWCLDYKAANAIIRFYMFCQHPHWHCIGVW